MQALAHLGLLGRFDYLSTVSGGGYTGGWLSAWLHRAGAQHRDAVFRAMDPSRSWSSDQGSEAPPVGYVRRTCQYLAPSGGMLSADFWTVLATMARNLVLNWMVLLPLVAAALLVPRVFYSVSEALEVIGQGYGADAKVAPLAGWACLTQSRAPLSLMGVALAGYSVAIVYIALVVAGVGRQWSQARFLVWCLLPLMVGAAASALFWDSYPCSLNLWWMVGLSAGIPTMAWLLLGLRGPLRWRTLLASLLSGPILGAGLYWFSEFPFGVNGISEQLYTVVAVPSTLLTVLVTIAVFVGLASRDLSDAALEWWSRCAAWIAIGMTGWLAAAGIVLYASEGVGWVAHAVTAAIGVDHGWSTTAVSVLLPLLSSLAGLAARTGGTPGQSPSALRSAVQSIALPLVLLLLLSGIGWVSLRAVQALEYHTYVVDAAEQPCSALTSPKIIVDVAGGTRPACHAIGGGLGESLLFGGGCLAFGLFMGMFVPANRFSLHGMYRQRLIRTFLGASRTDRQPDPFTGFDDRDDLRVSDLAEVRPLHILNATLNAVSSTSIGRHQRQSQAFDFTPLHVGNSEVGYRRAAEYGSDGGGQGTGLSLGMAMSVSGAAAASSMGMYSSKPRAFLLTLANARLGLWFGNPRDQSSWRRSDPPSGVGPVLRELLGLTTDHNPYVYLSDGGHYENLGLWSMVARRCRFIVVSDAGCDPDYGFDDLANAVRRIRLDLGISIDFPTLNMTKAGQGSGNAHGAVGTIHYSDVDGPGAPDGQILYLKATLSGDESIDIVNFARTDTSFPHDSTSDQFFDEARFESYRALGFHTVMAVAEGRPRTDVGAFVTGLES